jgi:hypothetical protein
VRVKELFQAFLSWSALRIEQRYPGEQKSWEPCPYSTALVRRSLERPLLRLYESPTSLNLATL